MTSTIELRLHSSPDNLAAVRSCVERYVEANGFGADTGGRVALAVDEALANIIRHGYRGRSDGLIVLRLGHPDRGAGTAGDGLRIEVEDDCDRFEPNGVARRDLTEVRPGGLGLHIIRNTFSRCSWNPRSPRGNTLVLELDRSDGVRFHRDASRTDSTVAPGDQRTTTT